MLIYAMFVFVVASSALGQASSMDKETIPTLTVCDALSHPEKYDGKMVRIRDQVRSTDEGAAFVGDTCQGIFVTDGKVWPSGIAWTMPTDLIFILHPVNFSYDWAASKRLRKRWSKLHKRFPDRCIAVTYSGMFESWSKEKARKTDLKGQKYEFEGFGHLNSAPAQLVLRSADDVAPIPNCGDKN